MRFKACKYTPKTCLCTLPEGHKFEDAIECNCCKHTAQNIPDRWSRFHYCKNGESCIMEGFPWKIHYQWEMMNRCITAVGMGVPDISVEKFRFWIYEVLEIDKDNWERIYDKFMLLLALSQKYKEDNSHIEAVDIERIRALSSGD